jgi:DNA repair protein RAD5
MTVYTDPAVESQAIQRVHRIGQLKEVIVKRFIVDHTVEQRILALQEKKRKLASSVGMSEEELKALKFNDLTSLFTEI